MIHELVYNKLIVNFNGEEREMTKKVIIDTIYLKESNIEIPNQIEILGKEIPEVKCDLSCQSDFRKIFFDEKETYEVSLSFHIVSSCTVEESNDLHLYIFNFNKNDLKNFS